MEEDEGPAAVDPRYLALTITTLPAAAEAVGALLWEMNPGGFIEEDGPGGTVRLRAYVPLESAGGLLESLRVALAVLPVFGADGSAPALTTEVVAAESWASGWKEHFHAFRVGRRLLIVPTWEEPSPRPDDVVIRLDPGMAFGSGLHPSTQLCLALLERHLRTGDTVADIGTGSGILAIAAARLGAAGVIAVDDDPIAVRVAAANVRQNGVEDLVTVKASHFLEAVVQPIDLIVANLTAALLEDMAPAVAPWLRPGGLIIASGIIETGLDAVREAFGRAGLLPAGEHWQEDWRGLVARRP